MVIVYAVKSYPGHKRDAPVVKQTLVFMTIIVFALLVIGCERDPSFSDAPPESQYQPEPSDSAGVFTPETIPSTAVLSVSGLVKVPNPLSGDNPRYSEQALQLPSVGVSLDDRNLGTKITRVTANVNWRHEYSRFDPFNADKSMIILLDLESGYFDIFRTEVPYDQAENMVTRLNMWEPRWNRSNPDLVIGINGFQILEYNVKEAATTLVKDFSQDPQIGSIINREPDLYRVTMKDEGETSYDGRWWVLALQGSDDDYRLRYLFTWDRMNDSIAGLLELRRDQSDIDWVGMSPKGNWVIIGSLPWNGSPLEGTVIANRELTSFHRIEFDIAHSDVGLDWNGNEVLVMQNNRTDYVDMMPLEPSTKPIMDIGGSYTGTGRIPLIRLYYDWSSPITFDSGVHISCNAPGWAVISTHIDPGTPERNWLDRSIILVRLDPAAPEVYFLSKIYNTTADYWEETHATVSNDGNTVVWVANFNSEPGKNRIYVVRLDLPR